MIEDRKITGLTSVSVLLTSDFGTSEAACDHQRALHFRPSRLWQTAKGAADAIALC